MKKINLFILLAAGVIILWGSCKKGSSNVIKKTTTDTSELAKLPPATQTGAHTFGCLINGKAFIAPPGRITNGTSIGCTYTNDPVAGYSFLVDGFDNVGDTSKSVIMSTDSLPIVQGQTLTFKFFSAGNLGGIYSTFIHTTQLSQYVTTNSVSGQLTISRFDTTAKIASGTFWFDAIQAPGDTLHIRNGRFDVDITLKN